MVVSNSSRIVKEEFGGQYTEPIIMLFMIIIMSLPAYAYRRKKGTTVM